MKRQNEPQRQLVVQSMSRAEYEQGNNLPRATVDSRSMKMSIDGLHQPSLSSDVLGFKPRELKEQNSNIKRSLTPTSMYIANNETRQPQKLEEKQHLIFRPR